MPDAPPRLDDEQGGRQPEGQAECPRVLEEFKRPSAGSEAAVDMAEPEQRVVGHPTVLGQRNGSPPPRSVTAAVSVPRPGPSNRSPSAQRRHQV